MQWNNGDIDSAQCNLQVALNWYSIRLDLLKTHVDRRESKRQYGDNMDTYYLVPLRIPLRLQLAFWQLDNNMQIATIKMNMIYKTYTCQFRKDFGTPTTHGFPSHSTILAGLVAQTFQNPWRKLPWNHDHLTTDHAQAGPTRSWLQGFDDFEWFWCIVQSTGPYYPSLVPPLDIPLPSFSLPFTSCRHLWTKKTARTPFLHLATKAGSIVGRVSGRRNLVGPRQPGMSKGSYPRHWAALTGEALCFQHSWEYQNMLFPNAL